MLCDNLYFTTVAAQAPWKSPSIEAADVQKNSDHKPLANISSFTGMLKRPSQEIDIAAIMFAISSIAFHLYIDQCKSFQRSSRASISNSLD